MHANMPYSSASAQATGLGALYAFKPLSIWLASQPEGWQLDVPDFAEALLVNAQGHEGASLKDTALNALLPLLQNTQGWANHRQALVLEGAPFLVAVFYERRLLRLYTPQLREELFYLELLKQSGLEPDEAFAIAIEEAKQLPQEAGPTVYEQVCATNALPTGLNPTDDDSVEVKTQQLVKPLLKAIQQYKPSLFERLSNWGLGLTAEAPLLRVYLLKFIAVLPFLEHDTEGHSVKRCLQEAFRRTLALAEEAAPLVQDDLPKPVHYLPLWLRWGLGLAQSVLNNLPPKLVAKGARWGVGFVAQRFILGATLEEAQPSLQALWASGRNATLDPLGELIVSPQEADAYLQRILRLIQTFQYSIEPGSKNAAGFYRAHISIKLSALSHDFNPLAPETVYKHVAPRLKTLLVAAHQHQVFITCDAEHYSTRNLTVYLLRRVLLEAPELKETDQVGVVVQGYLRDALQHVDSLIELGKERGLPLAIRLVKGAYWDAETLEADAHGWLAPQFLNKAETDLNTRQVMRKVLTHWPHVQLTFGSHNYADHAYVEALRTHIAPEHPPVEHQCLSRTYEGLSLAMVKQGWVVRDYVPIGDLIVGMAYLVRRIMENASQAGVLTIMRSHLSKKPLKAPGKELRALIELEQLARDPLTSKLEAAFANVAPARLFLADERRVMEAALTNVEQQLAQAPEGLEVKGHFQGNGVWQSITNPSKPEQVVGRIQQATEDDVRWAVGLAHQQLVNGATQENPEGGWASFSLAKRVQCVLRVANQLVAERFTWAAWIVMESGKTSPEALGDVDEAIDFLRFYAREEAKLTAKEPTLKPRGVIAVIAPWNFPLAIPCGMLTAALVGGNPVVIKSAGQTPLIVERLVQAFHAAGVPYEALIHLPGTGSIVGNTLANDERIAGLVFTGSYAVGKQLQNTMAKRLYQHPLTGQAVPVQVVAETGGKNAIIVTATADLDEAVTGIMASAFGHAGQKCSAASRVLVHQAVFSKLNQRLAQACEALSVGAATDWGTRINPVITMNDAKRLRSWAQAAGREAQGQGGRLLVNRASLKGLEASQCVGPVVIEAKTELALNPNSHVQQEAFGPMLHLVPFNTLQEAVTLFNAVPYGLTGGIFSQSDDEIDTLLKDLQAGNLYINRTITGARVAIEPFGGLKASGTGPKAGNPQLIEAFHIRPPAEAPQQATEEPLLALVLPVSGKKQIHVMPPNGYGQPSVQTLQARLNALKQALTTYQQQEQAPPAFLSAYRLLHPWLQEQAFTFITQGTPNQAIPGQSNWMNLQLPKPYTLLAAIEPLSTSNWLHCCLSLLAGSGLTSVTLPGSEAFTELETFKTALSQAGLTANQWQAFPVEALDAPATKKMSEPDPLAIPELPFNEALSLLLEEESRIERVLLQGCEGWLKQWLPIAYPFKNLAKNTAKTNSLPLPFRRVSTPLDALPQASNLEALWLLAVDPRAIAENTLRHGANLGVKERRLG